MTAILNLHAYSTGNPYLTHLFYHLDEVFLGEEIFSIHVDMNCMLRQSFTSDVKLHCSRFAGVQ